MSLTPEDRYILFKVGYTNKELDELDSAIDPSGKPQPPIDLSSPAWQDAMDAKAEFRARAESTYRRAWGTDLSRRTYERIVDLSYKGSPWDWLKITYSKGAKPQTDFQVAMKARIRAQQAETVGQFRRRR